MTKKTAPRLAAAALTAGVALALSAPAAMAAPTEGAVTATNAGYGAGYSGVINDHSAGYRLVKVEGGSTVAVYCLQEAVPFNEAKDVTFTAQTRADSGLAKVAPAAGIAVNSDKIGTPLENEKAEATAVQLAVWSLTDNLDYSSVENTAIKDRAKALVAGTKDVAEGPSSFVLKASAVLEGKNNVVTATLATGTGSPLAKRDLVLDLPTGADLTQTTNAKGVAVFTVPAGADAFKANVVFKGILPAGSVLTPGTGQKVVTADDAPITRTAGVSLAAVPPVVTPEPEPTADPEPEPTPVPEPTPEVTPEPTPEPTPETTPVADPDPTPTADPEPTPAPAPEVTPAPEAQPAAADDKPKELPYTGTWTSGGLALGALVLGAGAWYLRRRLA